MKNLAGFILPHPYPPKTRPVLGPNRRRGLFRGVCNTPLHGYVKNPPDFIFSHTYPPKTHPISPSPIRIRPKPARFHIPARVPAKNAPDFPYPNRDAPKTCPILGANLWRGTFRDVCFCALHGYMKNLEGFIPKPSAQEISGRMQYAPTRVRAKFGGFHIPAHDIARNPAGFGLCHTTWRETRRVLDFATRHSLKPGGFWTLPHDIARNPAGF